MIILALLISAVVLFLGLEFLIHGCGVSIESICSNIAGEESLSSAEKWGVVLFISLVLVVVTMMVMLAKSL